MHIAVCDDNVADRKQFERLIRREADRRATEEVVLFANFFGNADALLSNPMQYDIFYLDLCKTPGTDAADVVRALVEKGIRVPVVMCCSDVNYRQLSLPGEVLFLDKPIRPEELSSTIDRALAISSQTASRIELRDENNTYYVTEDEILYAIQDGLLIDIFLADGRVIHTLDSAINLFSQLETFPSFLVPTPKVLINGRHISGFKFHRVVMSDGRVLRIASECLAYAREMYSLYHNAEDTCR